jgi:hypothetical protein
MFLAKRNDLRQGGVKVASTLHKQVGEVGDQVLRTFDPSLSGETDELVGLVPLPHAPEVTATCVEPSYTEMSDRGPRHLQTSSLATRGALIDLDRRPTYYLHRRRNCKNTLGLNNIGLSRLSAIRPSISLVTACECEAVVTTRDDICSQPLLRSVDRSVPLDRPRCCLTDKPYVFTNDDMPPKF